MGRTLHQLLALPPARLAHAGAHAGGAQAEHRASGQGATTSGPRWNSRLARADSTTAPPAARANGIRGIRSRTPQKPQIDRREYHDNSHVYYQPRPEVMPEEQDIHDDHNGYHREHVKHDSCLSSHRFVLLGA